jgi:hypothetical protein
MLEHSKLPQARQARDGENDGDDDAPAEAGAPGLGGGGFAGALSGVQATAKTMTEVRKSAKTVWVVVTGD